MKIFAGAVLMGLFACGDSSAPPQSVQLELGTGNPGAFASIGNGDTVWLVHGPQGLQHIWICLRAKGLSGSAAVVDLSAADPSGNVLSAPFDSTLDFSAGGDPSSLELDGMRLVVPNPDDVLGKTVRLSARITNAAGVAADARTVIVQWEPGQH